MGTEVYPFRDMQVVDYGDIPCNPFNIPKVMCRNTVGRKLAQAVLRVSCPLSCYSRGTKKILLFWGICQLSRWSLLSISLICIQGINFSGS